MPSPKRRKKSRYLVIFAISLIASTGFGFSPVSGNIFGSDAEAVTDTQLNQGASDFSIRSGDQEIACVGEGCEEKKEGTEEGTTVDMHTNAGEQEVQVFGEQIGFFGIDPRTATAGEYVNMIYRFAMGVVGFFVVGAIMFGAFGYILSHGNEQKIKSSRDIILGALSALIIALLSHTILSTIDPQLVQLTGDFGGNVNVPDFQRFGEPIKCTSNDDCEDIPLPTALVEKCGGIVDDRSKQKAVLICDDVKKVCAYEKDSISAVFKDFALSCADNDWYHPGIDCKTGYFSRPMTQNDAEITGKAINQDYMVEFGGATYFKQIVPGGLYENVRRPDQAELVGNAQSMRNAWFGEYAYHKCLPPTAAQLEYDRTITSSGANCQYEEEVTGCHSLARRRFNCVEGKREEVEDEEDRLSSQTCEEGICRIEKEEHCAQEDLTKEQCSGWGGVNASGIRSMTSVEAEKGKDPCEKGTRCLMKNNNEQNPPLYECGTPGEEDLTGKAYWADSMDKEKKERLMGFACDDNSDCADFDQYAYQCDDGHAETATKSRGTNDSYRVQLVCDKSDEAKLPSGKGTCRIRSNKRAEHNEGRFCKQDGLACGKSGTNSINYSQYCESGSTCKKDPNNDYDDRGNVYTCQK